MSASGKRSVATVLANMAPSLFFLLHVCACLWWMLGSFTMYNDSEYEYDGEPLSMTRLLAAALDSCRRVAPLGF